jgi:DNA (cytosine-5)-methyltransferase 1
VNYYNEIDPYCCDWLEALIADGLIPKGHVDRRSILDVRPADLGGYAQCHFFTGLGGWSRALALAGWPSDRQVWTGSCPCQPFSDAGKRKGFADERHLWPVWFGLIRECRPAIVFGEQVARAIGHGWLDTVADDLEGEGYALGAAVLPACAVSAPHERQRLWFVADARSGSIRRGEQHRENPRASGKIQEEVRQQRLRVDPFAGSGAAQSLVANPNLDPRQQRRLGDAGEGEGRRDADRGGERAADVANAAHEHEHRSGQARPRRRDEFADGSGALADTLGEGLEVGPLESARQECSAIERSGSPIFTWPPEPDLPRVAHGVSARVAKLRALGNAIVPQVAAEFIKAAM